MKIVPGCNGPVLLEIITTTLRAILQKGGYLDGSWAGIGLSQRRAYMIFIRDRRKVGKNQSKVESKLKLNP